jgi:hypothetical protein
LRDPPMPYPWGSTGIPKGISPRDSLTGYPGGYPVSLISPKKSPKGTRPLIAPGVAREYTMTTQGRRDKIAHMSTKFVSYVELTPKVVIHLT